MDDYGYVDQTDPGADYEIGPNDITDFGFVWSGKLDGDTIASSEFFLPDGMTEVSSSNNTQAAVIFVSGGSAGATYRITSRIVTTGGRTWERTIRVAVRES